MNSDLDNEGRRFFSIRSRFRSFSYALNGIARFFKEEHNARIHLVATVCVGFMSYHVRLRGVELLLIIGVTGAVWVAEIFNTVVERIMDHLSPSYHTDVKYIKDLSAGAVLCTSIVAIIAGSIIFIPKIFNQ